ncbi:hypothetical protein BJX96DRAFT_66456 [Aspergillus floccosus]
MTIEPLNLHRDRLSVAEVDLHDPYVTANLGLFIIHNVLRRNLASCARHAKSLATANFEPFLAYTRYTLQLLEEHLRCAEDIALPVYTEWDPRFSALIDGHKQLRKELAPLKTLLATPSWKLPAVLPQIADSLAILQEKLYPQFDTVEDLVDQTARQIPLETIKAMDDKLEERRRQDSRKQGTVWVAFYLTRGLSPEERELGALRTPKHKLEGMLTAGELQFRR